MNVNDLHWTESNIECIAVSGRSIEIVASNVGFPKRGLQRVRVVFENVASSKRQMTEYIGNPTAPKGFREPYVVEELPREAPKADPIVFSIEGITAFAPIAWVDWEIEAASAQVFTL